MDGESRIVEVTLECEVWFKTVRGIEGSDEDGNRGIAVSERIPTTVQVLTRVPKAVEEWAQREAIDLFNKKYNS